MFTLDNIEEAWYNALKEEFSKPYFNYLIEFIEQACVENQIFPPVNEIFNAFSACSFNNTKVIIIGQDPYHGFNQANGLAFSVNNSVKIPPSLKNIFTEINSDLGEPSVLANGNLMPWAKQGVLLLNAVLTVELSKPGSHQNKGWEQFTDAVINLLNKEKEGLVFMLWGSYAQKKGSKIDKKKHLVLTAPHPSPLSVYRGFYGCKHFSKANSFLKEHNKKPITW